MTHNGKQDKPHGLPGTDGMTVPEGYFEQFVPRMMAQLPERPELAAGTVDVPRTLWQKVRPYVYMAAMFAGVWCMLKMFTMISGIGTEPMETNPIIAEAFGNDAFISQYMMQDMSQWDLYDELIDEGFTPAALADSLPAGIPGTKAI